MDHPLVIVAEEPPIAVVEMNRKAKRNALSIALRDAIEASLDRLARDDRIKAIVLTGGVAGFSAGFDLEELVETDLRALMHRVVEFTERTYWFDKPLVAAVGGFALAGGFDLALSGDFIVAAEGARFGRPEIGWGINPLLSKLWLRVGMPRALQMSLSGETTTAEQALSIGLVDRVVPADRLLEEAKTQAARLARAPLSAILAVKRAARAAPSLDARTAIEHEIGLSAEILAEGSVRATLLEYARRVGVLKS